MHRSCSSSSRRARSRRASWATRAESCPLAIGLETALDQRDPIGHYAVLMRLIADVFSRTPAILDVNCGRWHLGSSVQAHFNGAVEPPDDMLWVIQSVSSAPAANRPRVAWLHTHGLRRCGRPELEMLDVPLEHADAAAELVNLVASLLLEEETPEAGAPMAIGPELEIVLQPWQRIAAELPAGVPGSMSDREEAGDAGAHADQRAVICAKQSGDRWTWPETAVRAIEDGTAAIFQSRRATQRQAALAQRRWPALQHLLAAERGNDLRIVIKAAFASDAEGGREHLWFEVKQIDGDLATAELLNEPELIGELRRGMTCRVERATISDWQVHCAAGAFGPETIDRLPETIAIARVEPTTRD